ncbi:MAG: CBS domain-containing protein [Rhodocyclaceae bacterium]|nr:CBS domain-containing protein [Rhodocyclaceae bacterium]MCB1913387.1 CBS domain-containing protein [Rhodocyclaceae bacterium]MCP5239277.1 CBS domain-containing protein [Zoogloeaceae bacterium]MCP5255864.1 CBS domain-containing protein [Zoogloeaceae bacterium]MCW5616065.1 CBS domain-containing protein [Rhodocyclaceae bacterium]
MPTRPVRAVIKNQDCVTVSAHTHIRRVAELMKRHHTSAVLVTDTRHKRLLGICTERDIVFGVVATGHDPAIVTVEEIMTTDPQTISSDRPFGHALHLMYEGGFRHIPVVDDGHPVGILSAKDALGLDALQFESELVRREEIAVIL